eukprot:TRINITY_DN5477_c0_g1_i1.p1 TRINITY_DN5477_c0_g1~~TRINITY_DN5477_c0_g1_i1.p1  ORF type:complete len:363 (-),score=57.12 TRINITY_DN5477_c0_g1_i1:622-1710(-)
MRRPRAWLTGCLGCCSSGRCGGFMPNYSGISPDHRLTTSGARCLVAKLRLGSGAGADAAAAASSAPTAAATAPTAEDLAAALNSARPAYRTFMEQAIARLEGAMELLPYSVPEGMEGKGAVVGKGRNQQQVKMTVAAYSAAKFRHIRAALVETSGPTQVLNFVIFPDPSLDLPIFGADLVSLPGAHLICIDLQPPADPAQYPQPLRHVEGLAALAAHAQTRLPWGGDLPPAAQRFFSPHCIWSKVGDVEVVETAALDAMLAYLDHYLAMAAAAEPVKDEGLLKGLAEGHLAYSRYRRINDPARGMLTRFFGTEWAEDVISYGYIACLCVFRVSSHQQDCRHCTLINWTLMPHSAPVATDTGE